MKNIAIIILLSLLLVTSIKLHRINRLVSKHVKKRINEKESIPYENLTLILLEENNEQWSILYSIYNIL